MSARSVVPSAPISSRPRVAPAHSSPVTDTRAERSGRARGPEACSRRAAVPEASGRKRARSTSSATSERLWIRSPWSSSSPVRSTSPRASSCARTLRSVQREGAVEGRLRLRRTTGGSHGPGELPGDLGRPGAAKPSPGVEPQAKGGRGGGLARRPADHSRSDVPSRGSTLPRARASRRPVAPSTRARPRVTTSTWSGPSSGPFHASSTSAPSPDRWLHLGRESGEVQALDRRGARRSRLRRAAPHPPAAPREPGPRDAPPPAGVGLGIEMQAQVVDRPDVPTGGASRVERRAEPIQRPIQEPGDVEPTRELREPERAAAVVQVDLRVQLDSQRGGPPRASSPRAVSRDSPRRASRDSRATSRWRATARRARTGPTSTVSSPRHTARHVDQALLDDYKAAAYVGGENFAMVLKHTDIESAKRASERLFDLVSSSNFFISEQEIQLHIAIGVTELNATRGVDQTLICTIEAMDAAENNPKLRYMVCNE